MWRNGQNYQQVKKFTSDTVQPPPAADKIEETKSTG